MSDTTAYMLSDCLCCFIPQFVLAIIVCVSLKAMNVELAMVNIERLDIINMNWQKPFIQDIYAAEECEAGDSPVITEVWEGAQHVCYYGLKNIAYRGATCLMIDHRMRKGR
jgi:hypothetical protein